MSKHSRGPWIKDGDSILTEDGDLIATIEFSNDVFGAESEANGNLISAAPDGYEAAREALFFLQNYDPKARDYETTKAYRIQELKDFLTKARGEK